MRVDEDVTYLQGEAKEDLDSYSNLLLLTHVDILFYNEDEESFEPREDPDIAGTLTNYSHTYGEPFSSILEALRKGVVE